ncbi:hypothetical protein DN511_30320, partial [Burkholderia multivorans]
VGALGAGPLSPLAPIAAPMAGLIETVASGIASAGTKIGASLSSAPVQQATQSISSAITPLVMTTGHLTQQVGTASGLGRPVAGLLGQVGGPIASAGWKVSGAATQTPVSPLVG